LSTQGPKMGEEGEPPTAKPRILESLFPHCLLVGGQYTTTATIPPRTSQQESE